MRVEFLAATILVTGVVIGVRFYETNAETGAPMADEKHANNRPSPEQNANYFRPLSNEVRIKQGVHNQFFVTALVNQRPASFLVDTGASYVALRISDAKNAGIFVKDADFRHPIMTANGQTRGALVKVGRMEIDGIQVNDVDAFILPDAQLNMNLLGMSFLSALDSVEARNGELVLKG